MNTSMKPLAVDSSEDLHTHPHIERTQDGSGKRKRFRLVGLLRGYFATPVIATLGELGIADHMLQREFSISDFPNVRKDVLKALIGYLVSIGLIESLSSGNYVVSPEGRTIFKRNGAFSLLMSYAEYFQMLPDLIMGASVGPAVNRLRNVRGSGQLHGRKFFPSAFSILSTTPPQAIIDVGCGDGGFLLQAQAQWPGVRVFGVDLSETAVQTTRTRLGGDSASESVAFLSDGFDIERWGSAVPMDIRNDSDLAITIWFVCHEFSLGSVERIVEFFTKMRRIFPQGRVVVGEINKVPAEILALDYEASIMPEFLLFHELSNQGVLSWEEWSEVLLRIPYRLHAETRFDEVVPNSEAAVPASFLWLLEPR